MQPPYKIMFLFGTRAEVLKLAPIIRLLQQEPAARSQDFDASI